MSARNRDLIQRKLGRRSRHYAITGDYDGKVDVPGYNYLRYARINGVVQKVWDRITNGKPNIDVEIEYIGTQIVVKGLRGRAVPLMDNVSVIGQHADTHLEGAFDPVYIYLSQILNFRIVPNGFKIQIWQGILMGNNWGQPSRLSSIDLSVYKPLSGALWAFVSLDRFGIFHVEVSETADTLALLTASNVPACPFGHWAIMAIRLYASQTKIWPADMLDLRWAAMPYNCATMGGNGYEDAGVTIADGEITVRSCFVHVYGEGGAADNLDTINGGAHGSIVALCAPTEAITVKSGTGNIDLPDDVLLDDPSQALVLVYDDLQDTWIGFGVGGGTSGTTLEGLTDVNIASPADKETLLYDAGSEQWVNGNVGDIASFINWASSTITQGQDRDRTSGSSYASHGVLINLFRPLDLYQVKWDIGATGTYNLSLQWPDGTEIADLGDQVVSSVPAADVTWTASPRIKLMPGEYLFVLTPEANKAIDDNNTNCPLFFSFYYQREVRYGTSSSTSYTAALKLVGYIGTYNV